MKIDKSNPGFVSYRIRVPLYLIEAIDKRIAEEGSKESREEFIVRVIVKAVEELKASQKS